MLPSFSSGESQGLHNSRLVGQCCNPSEPSHITSSLHILQGPRSRLLPLFGSHQGQTSGNPRRGARRRSRHTRWPRHIVLDSFPQSFPPISNDPQYPGGRTYSLLCGSLAVPLDILLVLKPLRIQLYIGFEHSRLKHTCPHTAPRIRSYRRLRTRAPSRHTYRIHYSSSPIPQNTPCTHYRASYTVPSPCMLSFAMPPTPQALGRRWCTCTPHSTPEFHSVRAGSVYPPAQFRSSSLRNGSSPRWFSKTP